MRTACEKKKAAPREKKKKLYGCAPRGKGVLWMCTTCACLHSRGASTSLWDRRPMWRREFTRPELRLEFPEGAEDEIADNSRAGTREAESGTAEHRWRKQGGTIWRFPPACFSLCTERLRHVSHVVKNRKWSFLYKELSGLQQQWPLCSADTRVDDSKSMLLNVLRHRYCQLWSYVVRLRSCCTDGIDFITCGCYRCHHIRCHQIWKIIWWFDARMYDHI